MEELNVIIEIMRKMKTKEIFGSNVSYSDLIESDKNTIDKMVNEKLYN